MRYVYLQQEKSIEFEMDDLTSVLIKKDTDLITPEFLSKFNQNLSYILTRTTKNDFYAQNCDNFDIDMALQKLQVRTADIRNNILSKFLLGTNLHFLISNGCSLYAGSKAINVHEESEHDKLLANFKLAKNRRIEKTINELVTKRPEEALDNLYEILSYSKTVLKDQDITSKLEQLITDYKSAFVNNFVLTIDYSNNLFHKIFLKRIVSRDPKLNKVNIFTLNYDLLIEKSAEELGINVNNGFLGFHYRAFMPSSFHLDVHINLRDISQAYSRSINLFKLHGSLSWKFDSNKPPYGITEVQHDYDNVKTISQLPDCIIYPVQSKKKYSLDLPYSEMFRQFIEFINKPNSTLMVMGYSFLDEHVNDIITNALSKPDFNLVVFTYQDIYDQNISEYLKDLINRSKEDSRITIFSGSVLGNFEYIVKYLIPYPYEDESEKVIYETFKRLKNGAGV
ncbi:SIR2 family protein [Tuberibacillus calidus]|uniref:SIR2 family protein n=1 Tax=Tuberibacillus calidus TaxID=340097 RepID=UPI0004275843|nr:SIR2 family protein [Tuberibacillus calidus]